MTMQHTPRRRIGRGNVVNACLANTPCASLAMPSIVWCKVCTAFSTWPIWSSGEDLQRLLDQLSNTPSICELT